eukprot:110629-Hanusia_phi.AAC.2
MLDAAMLDAAMLDAAMLDAAAAVDEEEEASKREGERQPVHAWKRRVMRTLAMWVCETKGFEGCRKLLACVAFWGSDRFASETLQVVLQTRGLNDVSFACSYASLILHDAGHTIEAARIQKILAAANVTVDAAYPALFEKAMASADVPGLLKAAAQCGGGGGGGAPAAAAAAPAAGGAAPAGGKKAPEPEPEEEEDMGFSLFD